MGVWPDREALALQASICGFESHHLHGVVSPPVGHKVVALERMLRMGSIPIRHT